MKGQCQQSTTSIERNRIGSARWRMYHRSHRAPKWALSLSNRFNLLLLTWVVVALNAPLSTSGTHDSKSESSSHLPVLVIHTDGQMLHDRTRTRASLTVMTPSPAA